MGRRLLVFFLVAVGVFLVYKQIHRPLSQEEMKVRAVEDRFAAASSRFMGIAGGGLAAGLDSAEAAVREIQKVRDETTRLMKTLTEDKAIARAQRLKAQVDEFCRKNDIR